MRNRVLCILSIAVLALVTGLAAQTTEPAATQTITGKVVSSSSTSLVIETDTGTRQTFAVDAQSALPAELTPGTRISVDYHSLADGTFHAARGTSLGATASSTSQPTTEARPVETTPPMQTAAPMDTAPAPADTTPPATSASTDTSASTGTSSATSHKTAERKMPATASPLPLVSLLGLASLVGGAALRRFGSR